MTGQCWVYSSILLCQLREDADGTRCDVSARQRLLRASFNLLYGPLAACHEPIGLALFGQAWHARRLELLECESSDGVMLDIGCGEGRLLASTPVGCTIRLGVEPSSVMARRARHRGILVIRGQSQRLPLATGSVCMVVCSYPGPWLFEPGTWEELARVTRPGAQVRLLLGGTIERGPAARLRTFALRVGYGRSVHAELPEIGTTDIFGAYERRDDRWGEAIYWFGVRR
jgi:SAM-dependent methyltransferase